MSEASDRIMTSGGRATFFDGATSARHAVMVELTPASLRIREADGNMLDEWPYANLEPHEAPDAILRLGCAGAGTLARLEILDPDLAREIDRRAPSLGQRRAHARRTRLLVVGLSVAAMLSLVFGAVFAVPEIASLVAPLLPPGVERLLGKAVDAQVRAMLDADKAGAAFECGDKDGEKAGQAALGKLIGRLEVGAGLPIPLRTTAIRRREANAIALPGGHIYLFNGLIAKANTPDEVAAVLAHEIGHVAHRDGTRSVLQAAGLSFLFGMVLGDFVGGGAVVIAAKTVLRSAYSREVEAAADAYGVALMAKIGGDPHALATILARIDEGHDGGIKLLLDHPVTKERVAAIEAFPASASSVSLLEPAEWAALKRICT
jgi:Zn-dependent protease with chaperone function